MDTDLEEALRLLLTAEKKGNNIANIEIGYIYYFGYGVQADYISAEAHFRQAFLNGCMNGAIELADRYFNGTGVAQDRVEAFRLNKLAADAGCAQGQANVAEYYCDGVGTEKNIEEAERLFKIAVGAGNTTAQNGLGCGIIFGEENSTKTWMKVFG